ncbi:MAG: MFS transporter [Sediminicola sp.]
MFKKEIAPRALDRENLWVSTWLAFALLPLAGFATDIYIPSLPSMSNALGVGSIEVQFTLTVFLISYGVSQLFVGSILDSFGRHRIGIFSLIVFALASIAIAESHHIWTIYLMRALQGVTAGAVVVAKRAYFVDVFTGEKLKHYLSLFSIIWSLGPIIAPFLGGYLQAWSGWESNFYFLAILALIFAVLEYFFNGESLGKFAPFHLKSIVGVYRSMLATGSFIMGVLIIGISYAMVMVFNMTGAFIIEHHFHFTPITAGYSALILGFAWMVGGLIGKATLRYPFFLKLKINLAVQVFIGLLMWFSSQWVENLYSLVAFAYMVHVTAGFAFNIYFTYCLGIFPKNAGIASGLTGGLMYIFVSFFSYSIVYLIPAKDQLNLSYSYLILIAMALTVLLFVFKRDRRAALE